MDCKGGLVKWLFYGLCITCISVGLDEVSFTSLLLFQDEGLVLLC